MKAIHYLKAFPRKENNFSLVSFLGHPSREQGAQRCGQQGGRWSGAMHRACGPRARGTGIGTTGLRVQPSTGGSGHSTEETRGHSAQLHAGCQGHADGCCGNAAVMESAAQQARWCGHADELGVSGFNPESLAMLNVRISFVKLMDRWRSFGNKKGRGGLLVFIRH